MSASERRFDPETRGQIASIGIIKGKLFNSDPRMRRILTEAVAIGNAYARANTVFPRDPGHRYYPDTGSEWVMAFADNDTYFLKEGARRFDSRLWMHYNAIAVTPAMALTRPGRVRTMASPSLIPRKCQSTTQRPTSSICRPIHLQKTSGQ